MVMMTIKAKMHGQTELRTFTARSHWCFDTEMSRVTALYNTSKLKLTTHRAQTL